jgi:kynurenine formamidase
MKIYSQIRSFGVPKLLIFVFLTGYWILFSCSSKSPNKDIRSAKIVDLGGIVTEDLPEKVWGQATMKAFGFNKSNNFEIVEWKTPAVSGSNAYYTIFNHGGPHVDAPKHIKVGGGLDSYPVEVFAGPLKVFDVSSFPKGHTIPVSVFKGKVSPGDIVLIFSNYVPPQSENESLQIISLSWEASEYLATLPVRAFGTDALSADSFGDTVKVDSENEVAKAVPVHHSFLSRSIPIYEALYQINKLLNYENMYFIGVPLNIKNGDGMLVRPIAMVL